MTRTYRLILLTGAGILIIAGTFLPWVRWNNIWKGQDPANPTVGGGRSYQMGHENDPVYFWNGMGTTGGFDVKAVTYHEGVETSRLSATTDDLPKELMIFLVPAGLLSLVAAFLRRKWLVSLLCAPTVAATASVLLAAFPFISDSRRLEASKGFESLDPALGIGMFVLLMGTMLALAGGVLVWREPRADRGEPAESRRSRPP